MARHPRVRLLGGAAFARSRQAKSAATAVVLRGGGTPTPTPTPTPGPVTLAMATFFTSDQDSRAGQERDDNNAHVAALLAPDFFDPKAFISTEPAGLDTSYAPMFAAYGQDRAKAITHLPNGDTLFKTEAQLAVLPFLSTVGTIGAPGYLTSEQAGYDKLHEAAQRLIAQAQAIPAASSGSLPLDKRLWVHIEGGYSVLAQAAREAVELDQFADFFKRIVVVGGVNFNANVASPHSWNYLMSNHWPAQNTPGLFGDMVSINGFRQFNAITTDDDPRNLNLWKYVAVPAGAVGAYMEMIRANSGYNKDYLRCYDLGGLLIQLGMMLDNNYDPTVPSIMGRYQTWADGTGYSMAGITDNLVMPKWSPTWYAPPPGSIDAATAVSIGQVDVPRAFRVVTELMSRATAPRSHFNPPRRILQQRVGAMTPAYPSLGGADSIVKYALQDGAGKLIRPLQDNNIGAEIFGTGHTWSDSFLTLDGTTSRAVASFDASFNTVTDGTLNVFIVARPNAFAATQVLVGRDDGGTNRAWSLTFAAGGALVMGAPGVGSTTSPAAAGVVGEWALFEGRVEKESDGKLTFIVVKNGVELSRTTTASTANIPTPAGGSIRLGSRNSAAPEAFFGGSIAWAQVRYGKLTAQQLADIRAEIRAACAAKPTPLILPA